MNEDINHNFLETFTNTDIFNPFPNENTTNDSTIGNDSIPFDQDYNFLALHVEPEEAYDDEAAENSKDNPWRKLYFGFIKDTIETPKKVSEKSK